MTDDEFWDLVAVLDGQVDEDAMERLGDVLRDRGAETARAFQERLARALYELDRQELACLPVRWTSQEEGDEPIPLSDDAFGYLRAAVVARGRAVYHEVLADPRKVLEYRWDDGEGLLYVADEVTGDVIHTEYSHATGANGEHWTVCEEQSPPWGPGPCPVFVDVRDLSRSTMLQTGRLVSAEASVATGAVRQALFLPPRYLRLELLFDLGPRMARILLGAGGVPDEIGAPVIEVTVDVGDALRPVPVVGEVTARTGRFGVADGLRVRPVHVSVLGARLRSLPRDARESALTGLVAACVLAVLPEGHPAGAALERVQAEGIAHLT